MSNSEWSTREHRWTSPGGRYEIVIHTAFPPSGSCHIPRGALFVWDRAIAGRPQLLMDLTANLPPGPDLAALARGYAYLFALEDPGTEFAAEAIAASDRDGIPARARRLGLCSIPAGAIDGSWTGGAV